MEKTVAQFTVVATIMFLILLILFFGILIMLFVLKRKIHDAEKHIFNKINEMNNVVKKINGD